MQSYSEILKNMPQNFIILLMLILLLAILVATAIHFGKHIFPQKARRKRTIEEEKARAEKMQRNILMGDPHP